MILTTAAVVAYWMNPATPEAELANYAAWYENPYQLTDFVLMTLIGFLNLRSCNVNRLTRT